MNHRLLPCLFISTALMLVSGCSVAPHNAYDYDKAPENRKHYKGMHGYKQFIKDETFLTNKEQFEQCQRYLLSFFEQDNSGLKSACKGHQIEMLKKLQTLEKTDES